MIAGTTPVLVHNCDNVISNVEGHDNAGPMGAHQPGTAFSGVYDSESGTFRAHLSVDDDLPNPPANAVRMHGGHGQINFEHFGGSRTTTGFTMFLEDDSGISVNWLSRGVNGRNFGDPMAPFDQRQGIMDAIADATGWSVRSR